MRALSQIAFTGISMMALSAPAFAQGAPATEGAANEDIIVQARRRDESLQDVPLTVNAVSAQTIEKLNLRDLKDIAAVVPGLTLSSGLRATGASSSLRGVSIDANTSGNNPAVEFYLNDSPISLGSVLQSMYDIGQIEVLRGPQGTLRGRASPSGSITLTTRRPDLEEWGGYGQGTINDIGGYNVNGAINAPIIPGIFSVRVAGLLEDNEANRVRSINSPTVKPYSRTRSFRVSGRLTPVDGLEFNASYQKLTRNSLNFDSVESANIADPTRPASATFITARDRLAVENVANVVSQRFEVFNWQGQYSFAGQRLVYVGSQAKQYLAGFTPTDQGDYFDNTYPGDATLPNDNGSYLRPASTLNLQNYGQPSLTRTTQNSHELRLQSEERVFGMFDYVVGGFITKLAPYTRLNAVARVNLPANTITTSGSSTPGRVIERAIFGNLTAHLGEKTEISGGLRYLSFTENSSGSIGTTSGGPTCAFVPGAVPVDTPPAGFNPLCERVAADTVHKKTIWTGSIKHRFSDDFMVYAAAGSSFRLSSGRNALTISGTGIVAFPDPNFAALIPAIPESSTSYEIGFRSSLLDRKITFNVSAFYQKFNNFIFTLPSGTYSASPTLCATTCNAVPINNPTAAPVNATVKGVEAEIAFRPSDRFNISATMAYAKSEATGRIPFGAPTVGDAGQIRLVDVRQSASRAAPFSATVQAEYSQPINTAMGGYVRGLTSFYGNSKNDPTNPFDDVPAYALVNIYAGVRAPDGHWELSLYGKNVFNTFRVVDRGLNPATVVVSQGGVTGPRNSNYRLVSTTDQREFGLSLRYAFGSR